MYLLELFFVILFCRQNAVYLVVFFFMFISRLFCNNHSNKNKNKNKSESESESETYTPTAVVWVTEQEKKTVLYSEMVRRRK